MEIELSSEICTTRGYSTENLGFFFLNSHVGTIIIFKNSSLTMLNGAYSLDYRVAGIVFLAELHIYFAVIFTDSFQHFLKIFPSPPEDHSQD